MTFRSGTNYTVQSSVIPAETGIYNLLIFLDSRFRGNDKMSYRPVIPAKAGIQVLILPIY